MSAIAKEATKALRRKVPKAAQYWSRSLPSINVSEIPATGFLFHTSSISNSIGANRWAQSFKAFC